MISVTHLYLGGQFALSVPTPQSPAPLRSAGSLRGNHFYRGRSLASLESSDLKSKFTYFCKMNLEFYKNQALLRQKEHKKFLESLKTKPPRNLDYLVQETHEQVFEKIDCLQCANCCKTTGPLFTEKDIERIAKYLKMKVSDFEQKFLQTDEDQDKVLQNLPCWFLADDNTCSIYEVRPKACREFPHTDRKKIYQINHLTLKNTLICPAAYEFVEKMKENLTKK